MQIPTSVRHVGCSFTGQTHRSARSIFSCSLIILLNCPNGPPTLCSSDLAGKLYRDSVQFHLLISRWNWTNTMTARIHDHLQNTILRVSGIKIHLEIFFFFFVDCKIFLAFICLCVFCTIQNNTHTVASCIMQADLTAWNSNSLIGVGQVVLTIFCCVHEKIDR